jgi:hypothetical protein
MTLDTPPWLHGGASLMSHSLPWLMRGYVRALISCEVPTLALYYFAVNKLFQGYEERSFVVLT